MEILIITGKLFTTTDFPPVALLREKTSIEFVEKITEYLDGADGTNTNPMFVESFINFYQNQTETSQSGTFIFSILVSGVSEGYASGADFFIQQKVFSEAFLTHCLRFSRDINKIIDWALMFSSGVPIQPLTLEDAYYLTSIIDTISIPTYHKFYSLPDSCEERGLVSYKKLYAYKELNRILHNETSGTIYSDKDIFTVASLYSSEEIVAFVAAGHSLLHIILFYKIGLTTAEEVLESGHTIPREWLEVVKTQYV